MPLFRIRPQRPLSQTLKKVFAALVARVKKELTVSPLKPAAVHEARKSVKRLRALVSLIARDLGDDAKSFDQTLRDVNRTLSATRDATVALTTLEGLALAAENGLANDFAAARAALDRRLAESREQDIHVERDVLVPLNQLLQRWQQRSWPDEEWALLEPNLRKTYRKGRRMLQEIADGAPAEKLHDLRKLVKQTQYHAEFLMPIGVSRLQTEHDEWERLADLLGQHHDLWVLQDLLRTTSTKDLTRSSRTLVLGQIRQAASKLEQDISDVAPILYAERPRAFTDRWCAYWNHWNHWNRQRRG